MRAEVRALQKAIVKFTGGRPLSLLLIFRPVDKN